jgi:hypothetical protein
MNNSRAKGTSRTLATPSKANELGAFLPRLADIDAESRRAMLTAGEEALECERVLAKAGLNLVGEILRGQGEFVEMEHYPSNDVFDHETHSQYYYHAHRGDVEHGHFHTFIRDEGIPADISPCARGTASGLDADENSRICHLIAISMDSWGQPLSLFATNRWVTDETWYTAEDVITLLDRFEIDHAWPSWPTNRWIGAMIRLYRPWISALLRHRDAVLLERSLSSPHDDILEDRTIEITGQVPIDVEALIAELKRSL